ncbi:prisilkin-39 [Halyomorpha halys]|uniref:prisilkin-39 n=1 Tax=Halyomorpha halys TaxID=286706 RepID=UPI0006D510B6|nr:prisilkin-39-like [Halyomorpha halys]
MKKEFFALLVIFLIGAAYSAEVTTQKPVEGAKEDLKTAETFGFGFYAGGFPFGGYYGYPYGGYYGYPYKKFFGIGYPYFGRAYPAYPAVPVWG